MLALVAGGVAGTLVVGQGIGILDRRDAQGRPLSPSSSGGLKVLALLAVTAGAGYLIGGDKPGTFGRGVMYGTAFFPALVLAYMGGVALTGRT